MSVESRRLALLELHIAVLLFGLAGVLGKAIAAGAVVIVLGRSGIAAAVLGFGLLVVGRSLALPQRDRAGLLFSGLLLAVHWLTFFHAIALSSVAIGVVGFATFPLFVTVLSPLLGGTALRGRDMLTALAVLVGLILVAGPDGALSHWIALGWAVLSGLLFALLTLLNRHLVAGHSFLLVAFYQQLGSAICLLPVALVIGSIPQAQDLMLIAVLGVACSALAQTLFVKSLSRVQVQLASIVTGLEPVYAIALAALLIKEIPSIMTLLGAAIVLVAVTAASLTAARTP